MARITVEDCNEVESRFELVMLATKRAKDLQSGVVPTIVSKDKKPVVALREIAKGTIKIDALRNALKQNIESENIASQEPKNEQDNDHGMDDISDEFILDNFEYSEKDID